MSLPRDFLYVLPHLSYQEGNQVYQEFFKMVGNHQFLFRVAESRGGHPLISFPHYLTCKAGRGSNVRRICSSERIP